MSLRYPSLTAVFMMLFISTVVACSDDPVTPVDTGGSDSGAITDTWTPADIPVQDTAPDTAVPPTDTQTPRDDTGNPPQDTTAPPEDTQVTPEDSAATDTSEPVPDTTPSDTNPPDTTPEEDAALPAECGKIAVNVNIALIPGKNEIEFTYDNQGVPSTRTVTVQAPANLKIGKTYPIFFVLHGSGGGMGGGINQCKQIQGAGKDVICIVPLGGAQTKGGKPGWNLGSDETAEDDLTFFRTLWESLKPNPYVDTDQVYFMGSSMGSAFIANILSPSACIDFVAGIALQASQVWKDTKLESPVKPAVVIIHGVNDQLIPIDGGMAFDTYDFLSVEESLTLWAVHNGCDAPGQPVKEVQNDYTRVHYEGCDVPMVLYRLHDKAHNANVADWYGASNLALLYSIFVEDTIP
jgi:poly(3-hydroxybutyrate) depolymerase